jgi:benzoyl-CoA reductase/2-hydroxyglutaryl-CoA dehydratase subunit BcrC/BadD/HgdB
MAQETNAEGVVVFTHWGCKTTIGASGLIRDALEADGIPVLVLDGDGCNPANSSDGQLVTRVEAFLEMLEERRQ